MFDTEALRMQRAADVKGSGEERIFYQALVDRGFIPEVDFTYQADEFGGRAELGGLVADFMFPVPMVVVQVQSYWHRLSSETERRDTDQTAILQSIGYTVLEVWGNTINDPAALEDWMDRHVMHLWGTSAMPLSGAVERDEVFVMSTAVVRRIEERITRLEEAISGEVVTESELGQALQGFDIAEDMSRLLSDLQVGQRLAQLEAALFSGGAGGPAVRLTSAYIAQHLSSSNFVTGVSGWRVSRDGSAEFQDLTARGSMQSDNFVAGSEGWKINEDGDAEFHDVTVRGEITAAAFKYNAVSALGGAMMVGPASVVAADITDVATTVTVNDAQFQNGDFLYVKLGGTYEVMEVTGGGGTTSLTVTRGVDGSATAWKKGTALCRQGNRIVLDTVSANSPYLDIVAWAGPLFDDETVQVRLGNLTGISDPYMTPTGYGLYSDNVFLSGTAVFASGTVTLDSDGVTILAGINDDNFVKWKDSGNVTGQIQSLEDIADDRSLQLKVFPKAIGTDNVVQLLIAPFGGGETGCPALTLHGQVDSADPLQSYIRLDAGVGIAGATQLVVYEDGVYILNGYLRGVSSQFPDLGSTTVAEKWGDIFLHQAQKLYFDDDNDTYVYASGDDVLGWFIGGAAAMALSTAGLALNENFALITGKKFYFDSDLDSYMTCSADDVLDVWAAGAKRITINANGLVVDIGEDVYLQGLGPQSGTQQKLLEHVGHILDGGHPANPYPTTRDTDDAEFNNSTQALNNTIGTHAGGDYWEWDLGGGRTLPYQSSINTAVESGLFVWRTGAVGTSRLDGNMGAIGLNTTYFGEVLLLGNVTANGSGLYFEFRLIDISTGYYFSVRVDDTVANGWTVTCRKFDGGGLTILDTLVIGFSPGPQVLGLRRYTYSGNAYCRCYWAVEGKPSWKHFATADVRVLSSIVGSANYVPDEIQLEFGQPSGAGSWSIDSYRRVE
jgi:hypothetical protein